VQGASACWGAGYGHECENDAVGGAAGVGGMNARADRGPRLRRELVIALALKFAAIFVLWWLFFSNPVDEHLTEAQVGATVFDAAPAPNSPFNHSSKSEETPR